MLARYNKYLEDFDVITNIRLRGKVLEAFPTAHQQIKRRNPVIMFHEEMTEIFANALAGRNTSENTCILANAAAIFRMDILNFVLEAFKFLANLEAIIS